MLGHMIVLFSVFLRNLHTVFHHGYRNLPSHQQCIRISFSPDPGQYLFLVFSLITAILTGVRCYLTVVFIQISLMPSSSECLFMCLLVTCISSMGKCLFSSSAHFPIKLFAFLISNYMRCLYMLDINPLLITSFANIFFLVDSLFVLLMVSFAVQKLLSFSSVQFSRSVVSDSLRLHESQHARPPCPSSTPGVRSDSCPSSQ